MSSVIGLANLLAVMASFFLSPLLYAKTVGFVNDLTRNTYGSDWLDFTQLAWFLMTYALVFFIARVSISTALVFGGLAVATRFL